MRLILITIFTLTSFLATAQKQITNEDIWRNATFSTSHVAGFNFMNDGEQYLKLEKNKIVKYDIATGQSTGIVLDASKFKDQENFSGKIAAYSFNDDESKILIKNNVESIYRRSYLAQYHIYDVKSDQIMEVAEGNKIQEATLSPDGKKVAYAYENDLYYQELSTGAIHRITDDGKKNAIINGISDWVYEEEFSVVKMFFWSNDSQEIAFVKFDESEVEQFTMTYYEDDLYPRYETFKYPKVGEKNAVVKPYLYTLADDTLNAIDVGNLTDMYIPRMMWAENGELIIYTMNRHQNHLQLHAIDTKKQHKRVLLEEKNPYYINIHDNLVFLEDEQHFIWTSELDGYNHIYLYNMKGEKVRQLTKGDFEVSRFYGVDEKRDMVYYQSNEGDVRERHIYAVDLKGKSKKKLSKRAGVNSAQFSDTYKFYTIRHSTINTAPTYTLYNDAGAVVRILEDNSHIKALQETYGTNEINFITVPVGDGVELNGYMLKPADFDASKKYPVLITQYSGPGSQSVMNRWGGNNYWWYQSLAQQGIIVVSVDPRGTGGRGEAFTKMTYKQLGHYETIDLIETGKYLAKQDYIDGAHIGVFGWSYGGYMSSLAILKGNDVFSAAIAVAPVTSWKWYDTIYTERYMRTLAENESGYNENSPIYFADRLKGDYLLVHGVTDDNVHFQNTAEMANALIKANKQFDSYFYPNRNHGIYGKNARLHLYNKMTDFLKESFFEEKA